MRGEVLQRVRKKRNIIQSSKANWFGYIFRRNCLVKHVIYGKVEERIEVTER